MHLILIACYLLPLVLADTPANCTYDDVVGKWTFWETDANHDNSVNCSSIKPKWVRKVSVQLDFPAKAVDQYGHEGFWTLVYNQGFEVVLDGRKYFAFSNFKQVGDHVMSRCEETLPGHGWSHDVVGRNWACLKGTRQSTGQTGNKLHRVQSEPLTEKYPHSDTFVTTINHSQRSWTAVEYPSLHNNTVEDMLAMAGGRKSRVYGGVRAAPLTHEQRALLQSLPAEFDWRDVRGQNFVSPVRNQGACGSCYAFASAGMLEARWRLMTNNTASPVFSTQDIVDCSEYSQGCAGGFPYLVAGKYGEDFGWVTEGCNKYVGRDQGRCGTRADCQRYSATRYSYVGGFYGGCNEAVMMQALVQRGPLAVAFEVYNDFMHYKGGVYHHSGVTHPDLHRFDPFQLTNHAVLLVGYGTDRTTGEKFWTVKNSWGLLWGEQGYFRIRRGVDECHIESIAVESFPLPL